MTSEEILKSIKERAEKATDGPWEVHERWFGGMFNIVSRTDYGKLHLTTDGKGSVHDAEFIAASRTDVPRLGAALEKSRLLTSKFFTACLEGSFDKEFRSMVIDEIQKTETDIHAILTGEK